MRHRRPAPNQPSTDDERAADGGTGSRHRGAGPAAVAARWRTPAAPAGRRGTGGRPGHRRGDRTPARRPARRPQSADFADADRAGRRRARSTPRRSAGSPRQLLALVLVPGLMTSSSAASPSGGVRDDRTTQPPAAAVGAAACCWPPWSPPVAWSAPAPAPRQRQRQRRSGVQSNVQARKAPAYTATKTLTRVFTNADGTTYDFPSQHGHGDRRRRPRTCAAGSGSLVSWTRRPAERRPGQQPVRRERAPPGVPGRRSCSAAGSTTRRCPTAKQLRPETCWTASVAQRSQITRGPRSRRTWTHDLYAEPADKERVSGVTRSRPPRCARPADSRRTTPG